jgi:peptidoglycan/xylan/chitin deacetylase (PgdA/CDA1 family)
MKRLLLLALLLPLHAEDPATPPSSPPDDGVRVSVLGYHDFSETLPETEMLIRTSKFRKQMEAIKNAGLPVIPMADFQAWKRGEKDIADKSIVITIDDGWKAVHTDAFPILKEFGFPFTLFLYKNYVDGGGKALTSAMITEMMKHGATIGSHSVSHPYPGAVKSKSRKSPADFDAFLRHEFGESKRFLEAKFGVPVRTYAYPGGYHTEQMFPVAAELGYQHLFTVLPGKIRRSHDDHALPRYIILGTHDRIFDLATGFNEVAAATAASPLAAAPQSTPFPVQPEPGAIIDSRLPLLAADLSSVADLDPATLVMKVGGFGEVPATFDDATKSFSWQVNRRLRSPVCQVSVSWLDSQGKPPEIPLRWSFRLDPEAAYLPMEESSK